MAGSFLPIADYGFLSDCHSAALVSRGGSVDWCCMPRLDAPSCFGRLLDRERGGYCAVTPLRGAVESRRRYLDESLMLETTLSTSRGEIVVLDLLVMEPERDRAEAHLLRIVTCAQGAMDVAIDVCPRFDYGEVRPWIRRESADMHSALGGDDALLVWCDAPLSREPEHELHGRVRLAAGETLHLSLRYMRPHQLDAGAGLDAAAARSAVQRTRRVWQRWVRSASGRGGHDPTLARSALVLKGLSNRFAGSIAAAATTSLPEVMGGERNWDYRYCWVRDASLAVRAMSVLGYSEEADAFSRFVQRSSAGHADELQIAYGVEGARRLGESRLDLEGYRGSQPVRVGNGAARQLQLDVLGELVLLAWRWHERGNSPDDDAWRFLVEVVDRAAAGWREPDHGIWEQRGPARHFVHSKAMCWAALDHGLALARDCMRSAPQRRWTRQRDALRRAIERQGIDRKRGVLVRDFGSRRLDAATLLVPNTGLLAADDDVMVRTADAIREELEEGGMLRRYTSRDGLPGREGCFLACSFWLAEVLAAQGRQAEAEEVFERASATANDLGLFSEEYDPHRETMLGNFPQALTHLSHVLAGAALDRGRRLP